MDLEKLTLYDFTFSLINVEDKKKETSLILWFNSCNLDQDGIISLQKMHELFDAQKERMFDLDMEPVKFKYIYLELIDIFGDNINRGITVKQLQEKQLWPIFFIFLLI